MVMVVDFVLNQFVNDGYSDQSFYFVRNGIFGLFILFQWNQELFFFFILRNVLVWVINYMVVLEIYQERIKYSLEILNLNGWSVLKMCVRDKVRNMWRCYVLYLCIKFNYFVVN